MRLGGTERALFDLPLPVRVWMALPENQFMGLEDGIFTLGLPGTGTLSSPKIAVPTVRP